MSTHEIVGNIIIAMINSKLIAEPNEIAKAYKIIYDAVRNPENN